VDEAELEQRRQRCTYKPQKPRQRVVSAALAAYAKLTTSADRGAVRDVSQLD
jgi:dihydroxy-acid dehydratase